jgi:protein tyrosine phosphatase (PTP) superfamily phosphohydrolase (DUF442 family)
MNKLFLSLCIFGVITLALACGGGTGSDNSDGISSSSDSSSSDSSIDSSSSNDSSSSVAPTPTPTPHSTAPLSGAGLPNLGTVLPNQLSRSGQPTTQGLNSIKNSGVDVILKLNMNGENNSLSSNTEAQDSGKQVLYRPLNFMSLDCGAASNIADLLEEQISAGKWVLVHCTRGVDRAGLIIGLWKMRYQGQTFAQIQSDWARFGTPSQNMIDCLKQHQ